MPGNIPTPFGALCRSANPFVHSKTSINGNFPSKRVQREGAFESKLALLMELNNAKREPNFIQNKGEKERDICMNQTKYDDDETHMMMILMMIKCDVQACMCTRRSSTASRSPLRKRKTLFSSSLFFGRRRFSSLFAFFLFSKAVSTSRFLRFKTNAFGCGRKDLPIYPRLRIRALTCHLGCLEGVVLNNRSSSSVCRRSSPRSFWLGGFRRRTFGVGARGAAVADEGLRFVAAEKRVGRVVFFVDRDVRAVGGPLPF